MTTCFSCSTCSSCCCCCCCCCCCFFPFPLPFFAGCCCCCLGTMGSFHSWMGSGTERRSVSHASSSKVALLRSRLTVSNSSLGHTRLSSSVRGTLQLSTAVAVPQAPSERSRPTGPEGLAITAPAEETGASPERSALFQTPATCMGTEEAPLLLPGRHFASRRRCRCGPPCRPACAGGSSRRWARGQEGRKVGRIAGCREVKTPRGLGTRQPIFLSPCIPNSPSSPLSPCFPPP